MARRRQQQQQQNGALDEREENVALLGPTGADDAEQYDETAPLTIDDEEPRWKDASNKPRSVYSLASSTSTQLVCVLQKHKQPSPELCNVFH